MKDGSSSSSIKTTTVKIQTMFKIPEETIHYVLLVKLFNVKMASKNPGEKKYNKTKDLRCSTRLLNEKFQHMSDEKKVIIWELGFDGLMHIPLMNLPHKLMKELAYSFNVVRNRLDTQHGELTINPENIGVALGLNASGDLFSEKVNFKELSEEEKEGKTLKNLTDEMMEIGVDTNEDRIMFKRFSSSIFK
ncbi:hypothetical protein Ahy_B08g092058 [Arachis hypogaea]|uniref:Uncharacterized protein n=1 Tax=Arachis hypogaea TaxID=3818 RepID=A0A444Y396_ARAHY|nr:hypothetical protein Ahy_B08g092058 [Arachis hypogaea]